MDRINHFHAGRRAVAHAAVVVAPHEALQSSNGTGTDTGPGTPPGPGQVAPPPTAPPHPTGPSPVATHEPSVYRAHATVVAFDNGTYTATISLARSPQTTIALVPVSRSIAAALMVAGATAAVIFFDHQNSADSMIVGVH